MGVLSRLFGPPIKTGKALLVVNAEGEEYSTNSFIEGTHDGSKGFLTGLSNYCFTVSQICNLTCVFSSILTVFEVNSTPTVTLY